MSHNTNAGQGVGCNPSINGKEDLIRPIGYSKQDGRNYPGTRKGSGTVLSSCTGSSESGRWGRRRVRFSFPCETSGHSVAQASRAQLQPVDPDLNNSSSVVVGKKDNSPLSVHTEPSISSKSVVRGSAKPSGSVENSNIDLVHLASSPAACSPVSRPTQGNKVGNGANINTIHSGGAFEAGLDC